jgi:hypothetical protein
VLYMWPGEGVEALDQIIVLLVSLFAVALTVGSLSHLCGYPFTTNYTMPPGVPTWWRLVSLTSAVVLLLIAALVAGSAEEIWRRPKKQ